MALIMQSKKISTILSKAEVLKGLGSDDLKVLLAQPQIEKVDKDQVVITEGQHGEALYIILSGQFKVLLEPGSSHNPNRFAQVYLATLKPSDCFGEYSFIDSEPASASVIATEPSELFKLTKSDFDRLSVAHERIVRIIYYNLLRLLIHRLRKKDKELDFDAEDFDQ